MAKSLATFAKTQGLVLAAALACLPSQAPAQATPGILAGFPLALSQVVEKLVQMNAARFKALQSYRGRRT